MEVLPTICVMGATGAGKGSTLNSCFGCTKYSVSHMFSSDTVEPVAHSLPWRGSGDLMRGVDLCGFSDSQGRDTGFIEAMVSYLRKEVNHIHCCLLLFNSQEARIGIHLKDMLLSLKEVFGLAFMKNVMVGFTRWEYTKRASILRRSVTKETLSANINLLLRELLGHDHDCDCIFLDNTINMCTKEELQELYGEELPSIICAFEQSLQAVHDFAVSHPAFNCAGIEGALASRDVGRDMVEREKAAFAEGKDAFDSLSQCWDALGIQEPEELPNKMQRDVQEKRDILNQYLAAKTKPDLEHVKEAVLQAFDASVPDKMKVVSQKNYHAANAFNTALRKKLLDEYRDYIRVRLEGPSGDPQQVFQDVHKQDREIIRRYADTCQGGSLSWGAFHKMQEDLRMEQFIARDEIFGKSPEVGELPGLRPFLSDADALIKFLGDCSLPKWLLNFGHSCSEQKPKRARLSF